MKKLYKTEYEKTWIVYFATNRRQANAFGKEFMLGEIEAFEQCEEDLADMTPIYNGVYISKIDQHKVTAPAKKPKGPTDPLKAKRGRPKAEFPMMTLYARVRKDYYQEAIDAVNRVRDKYLKPSNETNI